ncbi:MAG: nitroreductase family protein [Anaerolineae bacterium]|nr:nitroreductase family protein [Anaerolineae bacterium]
MADLLDIMARRRSIRRMKDTPIAPDVIERLFEAARLAPSWANSQCWDFIAVTDPEKRARLARAGGPKAAMEAAPLIVVACARPQASGHRNELDYFMLDMGIAVEHLVLEATSLGLGTCWVGWFDEDVVKDALNIPADVRVVALVPVGYPAEDPPARVRRSLPEILSWNGWQKKSP